MQFWPRCYSAWRRRVSDSWPKSGKASKRKNTPKIGSMNIPELIQQLNSTDENHQIEAKRGSAIDKSFMETVCAFSNEPGLGGGYIILGVVRDDNELFPFYKIEGINDADKLSQDIASRCANTFNVSIRPKVETHNIKGRLVIGVYVPEVPPSEKPVYFTNIGLPKGALRRVGSTDQSCTEDDMVVFYGGRRSDSYDTTIVHDADIDDLDKDAIEYYRKLRTKINPNAEEIFWTDEEILRSLYAVKKVNGELRPTVAGVLLFGTKYALRRLFPLMRVDYIRVPGKEWVENPGERFFTIDMRGPLLQLVQRVQDAVADDLPKGFFLPEGSTQATTTSLSTRVLREAIVNAVMHRSYREHSPVQVIRYSNRLEIANPGFSLKAEEQLGEPGSDNRNPYIAAVFHETNTAETKGSGIKTMRKLMNDAGFAPPTFESDRKNNKFTARLLLHHFLSDSDIKWLKLFDNLNINESQKKAVLFIREMGVIDNASFRQVANIDAQAASKDLRSMCSANIIEKKGKSTSTYYVPSVEFNMRNIEKSHEVGGRQDRKVISVGANEKNFISNVDEEFELTKELSDKIAELGDRSSKERIREVIISLCSVKPFTAIQLGALLNREHNNLRVRHLRPLVKQGKLAYTISNKSAHPYQAYTVPS